MCEERKEGHGWRSWVREATHDRLKPELAGETHPGPALNGFDAGGWEQRQTALLGQDEGLIMAHHPLDSGVEPHSSPVVAVAGKLAGFLDQLGRPALPGQIAEIFLIVRI